MGQYEHIRQPFEAVYHENSEILILGSLPSVRSREQGFYYGHPQNRFWRVLAAVFCCEVPATIDEKINMLLKYKIALWDVIEECDIIGSSDSSVKNVVPADISGILKNSGVKNIFVNGRTAEKYYNRYILPKTGMPAVVLPSSSPANAAFSLEKLIEVWTQKIKEI